MDEWISDLLSKAIEGAPNRRVLAWLLIGWLTTHATVLLTKGPRKQLRRWLLELADRLDPPSDGS